MLHFCNAKISFSSAIQIFIKSMPGHVLFIIKNGKLNMSTMAYMDCILEKHLMKYIIIEKKNI